MNRNRTQPVTILVADDDADDREMIRDAFQECQVVDELRFVEDGEELMDYLYRRGKFSNEIAPMPSILLLDLNMPRKDGREALREIKSDRAFRAIRVIVMTTSTAEEDILQTYDLSVTSYITKPVKYPTLVEVIATLGKYWLQIVELPGDGNGHS